MLCRKCGNTGSTRDNPLKCDSCGKESIKVENINSVPLESKDNINYNAIIPIKYKDTIFSAQKLKSSAYAGDDKETLVSFGVYCNALNSIYNSIMTGTVPRVSLYIGSRNGTAKRTFAYSLIKECIKNKLSVMPILDLKDVYHILTGYVTEEISECLMGVTAYDIYTVDLCILYIDRITIKYSYIIQHILDKRSKLNKSTIFISNLRASEIKARYPDLSVYFDSKSSNVKGDTQYLYTIEYFNFDFDFNSSANKKYGSINNR